MNQVRFWSSLLIVASTATMNEPKWRAVADSLGAKHSGSSVSVLAVDGTLANAVDGIRKAKPRYVAFVMRPEEVDFATTISLRRMMRDIDDDPFDDAIWGIVTGPDAEAAARIASSHEPRSITTALATTGIGESLVSGEAAVLSDAYPAGGWWRKHDDGSFERGVESGDMTHLFERFWREIDPQLIVTSSHASQFNLEMPFSRGNVVPKDGAFSVLPDRKLIDDSTGQYAAGSVTAGDRLSTPIREKVWIAAGNCLIADNLPGGSMVMTALGFGKVNQFVGYISTTWYGEIGWGTWRYFNSCGCTLAESWYTANQVLLKNLCEVLPCERDFRPDVRTAKEYQSKMPQLAIPLPQTFGMDDKKRVFGMLWDRDATVFYGDPMERIALKDAPAGDAMAASGEDAPPMPIIFERSVEGRRLVDAPEGFEVFVADDFALVTRWPECGAGWRSRLKFSGPDAD